MRIFLYEYISGGGLWGPSPEHSPSGSLLAEGAAMAGALAADMAAQPEVEVTVLRDRRLAGFDLPGCRLVDVDSARAEQEAFQQAASTADATLLIAPEWNGELAGRARLVLAAGGKLLSPGPEFIELTADKHRTAKYLRGQGIPAPLGVLLEPGQPLPQDFLYPAVLKPVDGAGSCDVRLIESADDCRTAFPGRLRRAGKPVLPNGADYKPILPAGRFMRLEHFYPGTAASVAALTGPAQHVVLPACFQHLSDDGCFSYLGGKLPLPEDLERRARSLAEACLAVLPPAVGYIGFDLVLGARPDGGDDVVIEINPRLTTSYVGLRALSHGNLGAAMLDVALGRTVELSFAAGPIEFHANGHVGAASGRFGIASKEVAR